MARKQKFEKVHTSDPEDNQPSTAVQIDGNGTEQRCALQITKKRATFTHSLIDPQACVVLRLEMFERKMSVSIILVFFEP